MNIKYTNKISFTMSTKAVFKTDHLLGIATENSFLIATIGLLSKFHLMKDSFTDLQFHIIKVLLYPAALFD